MAVCHNKKKRAIEQEQKQNRNRTKTQKR